MGKSVRVATEQKPQDAPRLKGSLGFPALFFSVMAYNAPLVVVIGAIPIMVAGGAGIGTPFSFIAAGAVLACFAVGFTRMAKTMPKPGGFYSMITAGLGRSVGLGAGFMALLGYFCAYGGGFAFGGVVLGELVHNTLHGPDLPWYVWGAVYWVGTAVLGYLKVELSAKVLTVFLFCEVVLVLGYNLFVLIKGGAGHAGISMAPLAPQHWFDGSFSLGLLFALGMFGGFEVTVLFREEVRDPDRNIPRATYGVIAVAVVIYALSSLSYLNSFGVDNAVAAATADPTGSMTSSLAAFGGHLLSDLATVMVNTSTFAVLLAAHNITARYLFNLSADKIFPGKLSSVHRRHGSPHIASITTSAAALVVNLVVIATGVGAITFYTAMIGITSFVILAVIFTAGLAILVCLNRHASQRYTAWSRLVFPVLAILGLGAGLTLAAVNFPLLVGGSWGLGLSLLALIFGLFALGIVLARVYRRVKPEIYAKLGRQ